jgi:hypothetical protein
LVDGTVEFDLLFGEVLDDLFLGFEEDFGHEGRGSEFELFGGFVAHLGFVFVFVLNI